MGSKQKLNKKLLFLGQYPLDTLNSAPKVRTYNLFNHFKELTNVDFITGTRSSRRVQLWSYLLQGKLHNVKAIYLESATSTSSETDLLFLVVAALLRIPIGIYIRDAHPLFNMVDTKPIKNKLLILAWHISIWFYLKLAKVLYFPSADFAKLFKKAKQKSVILPPGGRLINFKPLNPNSKMILYAGGLSQIYSGIELLFQAIEELSDEYPELCLLCVSREEEKSRLDKWREKKWLIIKHLNFEEILDYKDNIYFAALCLNKSPYSDLALPVKLFDYLSLGKPVLATESKEIRNCIENHNVGRIVSHSKESFVENIRDLINEPDLASQLALNAHQFIQSGNTWKHRAQTVLDTLI